MVVTAIMTRQMACQEKSRYCIVLDANDAIVTEEIEKWHDMWSNSKAVYPPEMSGLSEEIP